MINARRPTPSEFARWRNPIRGAANPQDVTNPVWLWCVENATSAYEVNREFSGPDSQATGPCWSFQREGQAVVELPEGGSALIAGEHEDFYDPDFYIYNDVVVRDAAGRITILGYPEADFPPTDFHSATLVDRDIYLIGNLGYAAARVPARTQVLRMEIDGWRVTPVTTTGQLPGWIHGQTASLSDDSREIVVRGGKVCRRDRIVENLDDYALCLQSGVWRRLTHRAWRRWLLERADGNVNELWSLRMAVWNRKMGWELDAQTRQSFAELPSELVDQMMLSRYSPAQLGAIERLYDFPHCEQQACETDEHGVYQLMLRGTPVRINEGFEGVTVTVEGRLPDAETSRLLQALQANLEAAEQQRYHVIELVEDSTVADRG